VEGVGDHAGESCHISAKEDFGGEPVCEMMCGCVADWRGDRVSGGNTTRCMSRSRIFCCSSEFLLRPEPVEEVDVC